MVGWLAFASSARKLLKVGNFFPRKLGVARACFVLSPNRSTVPFNSINTRNPSSNLYSTLTPGGIVKSSYTVEIPDVSLKDYVLSNFDEYGDDLAMIDSASERVYTYRELKSSIIKMGSALTKRGFKKGDVFALLLPNIPEYSIFFLGVAAVGGVVTTLNPMYSAKEIAIQLNDSGAQYLATIPAIAGTAMEAATEAGIKEVFVTGEVDGFTPFSSLLDDNGSAFPEDVQIDPKEDICVMPYSSGTTGLPKGVMLTHHNLVSQMCILKHDSFRARPMRAVALAFLPFFHIFGMVVVMMAFLQRGGKIVCMIQFDGELMLKLIQEYKVNALYIAPPVATFLAKHPSVEKYNLTSLDSIVSGAAPLGEELTELMRNRFPTTPVLGQGFGLTETSPAAMYCPRNTFKPGSVGVMLPNLEGKVVDVKTGETLGPNQDGEVCIRGPTVMKGYLNNQKATAAAITPEGWFHTGDVGHYDDEGHFFIVDRLKDLIKYKGFQVPPAELEAVLHMHPNIYDVAVIGVPDSVAGEVPKAFIVPKGDITEGEVANFVAERVASYKKLRGGVEFIDQIPKSASGKILKRELKKLM